MTRVPVPQWLVVAVGMLLGAHVSPAHALRHFQCYKARTSPAVAGPSVTLADQLASGSVAVGRTERLCAPADKNGEDPGAPADPEHLLGYRIRHAIAPVGDLRVDDQFGAVFLDVVAPDRLMVPSLVAAGVPPPLGTFAVDHFRCYRVRGTRGRPRFHAVPGVSVTDAEGSASVTVSRPIRLCLPADKNGESPAAVDHPDLLLCYRTMRAPAARTTLDVRNQLGLVEVERARRTELCVPAQRPQSTTTSTVTTTSTITSTTSTVTTTSTSTSSTLPPGETCCDDFYDSFHAVTISCGNASSLTVATCLGFGGTPVGSGDAVCDATGNCVASPGTAGGCCQVGDSCARVDSVACTFGYFGTYFPSAVCSPSGACVP